MVRKRINRQYVRALLEPLEPRVLLSALPVINLTATKPSATELNGLTTGAGTFKLTRSGSAALPLTVQIAIDPASTAANGIDFNSAAPLTTVTFAAGSASSFLTINPVDTGLADGPKKVVLDLLTSGTAATYTVGSHKKATVTIVDHAPTVTLSATKMASELTGAPGLFTFKRTGPLGTPLTVHFTVAGNALEGTDYTTLSSHTVTFAATSSTATLAINPVDDDSITEGKEKVTLTLAADATPASYHFKPAAATVTIADDTRPIVLGTVVPLTGAITNSAFAITYSDLLAATGAHDRAGRPISFKITALKTGTLTKNAVAAKANKTTLATGESLSWLPPAGSTGSLLAFSILATDGKSSTPAATITISVSNPPLTLVHPAQMQVLPAALDQPQINLIAYLGNNTTPQVGQTTTLDPDTLDEVTLNTFNVTGYLDTGASGILISNPMNSILNLPLLQSNGQPVIYSDVGVAGSDDFQVSDTVRLSLANFYQRTDLDQFSDQAQTIPITSPYTPLANPVRVQVGPFVPTVDNPITDEFSSLFDELSALDVIGMPAMQGRVTVIDPTRVNSFGDVMDALLNDPDNLDLSALDADFSVHSFIYAPGTPFHSGTTATDPGIPTTDFHVKLSYANFDRFTTVTPEGQPGPTLVHNPFIGQDPVRLLEGTAQPAVPGIKITRTIDVPAQGGGGTTQQTLSSEGNWLLDTGAAASIISKAQAAKLHVTYQDGTFGTDNPVLVDDNGTPLPNQFHLGIGGIGGQTTLAGFYLDSMLIRSQEGSAADDANPNNLLYTQEPVLVGDITVKDPTTNDTLTLDGIFGMNNLIGSADFSLDSLGNLGDFAAAAGYYKWITFDEPNGILGLTFNPDVVNAPAAAAVTPSATLPAVTLLTAAKPLGTAAAQPTTTTTLPQTALPIVSATPPSSAIPLVVASSLQTPSPTLTPVTSNPAVLEQQLATSTPPSPTLDLPTLQEFLAVTL